MDMEKSYFQNTKIKRVVVLGSTEHQDALVERLIELDARMSSLQQSGSDEQSSSSVDTINLDSIKTEGPSMIAMRQACILSPLMSKRQKLELLTVEARVRTRELNFIREVSRDSEETKRDEDDELTIPEQSDSETEGSSSTSVPSGIELDEVIQVTRHETFGHQRQKDYNIKPKERLFRRPKVRQYFYNGVLHRSSEEFRTTWLETFVDLLYVGVFCKAGLIVMQEQSWDAFQRFMFLMVPLIEHWKSFTQHNNWIYHGMDLYHKVHTFLIMTSLMIMGNSLTNAFSSTPDFNTSTIFVASFIIARVFLIIVQMVTIYVFNRKFWTSAVVFVVFPLFSLAPYVFLLVFPVNDIEHTAERLGALYVNALGVVAVSFLYDTKTRSLESTAWIMILALMIGANLNHLYFRSEGGSHYQHALRRVWYTGVLWHFIHYPIVIFTLSLGGIMSAMITSRFDEAEGKPEAFTLHDHWKNIFFVSIGAIYFCFLVLRVLHLEHPEPKAEKDSKKEEEDGLVKPRKLKIKTRMPNLSFKQRVLMIAVFTIILLAVGIAVPEWTVDGCFLFVAGISTLSVVLMEWGILKRAKKTEIEV
ncbi:UNVERIFIED_CONTAM: hypothetical protein HDU68_002433 [Siphonaria sp. JEL0065]|nr:hypothetical protein HDU68_002433 [Siphonaria sp. JEL0065]